MPFYQICIQIPEKTMIKLEEIEKKYGVKKEDLLLRALVKILEEEFK